MRFKGWEGGRTPELGDIACQASGYGTDDYETVRRSYLVVGVEEGRDPRNFRLLMERVEFGTLPDTGEVWGFYNVR